MLIFEGKVAYDCIKEFLLRLVTEKYKLLVFDNNLIDQSKLDLFISRFGLESLARNQIRFQSLDNLISNKKNPFQILEVIRKYICEALYEKYSGIFLQFNFYEVFHKNKDFIFNLESIVNNFIQKSFGFPVACCCLYPSSVDIIDFAKLAALHTEYQIYDESSKPRIHSNNFSMSPSFTTNANTQKNHSPSGLLYPIFPKEKDSIKWIIKRLKSGNISPFNFHKGDKIIGIAKDLKTICSQLVTIPLECFCFHCYRLVRSGTKDNVPRSDISLWIEYSLGDTKLASLIYDTIISSIGDQRKSLSMMSRFRQLSIRSSILKIIEKRMNFFLLFNSITLKSI